MIYKFQGKRTGSYVEVQKEKDNAKLSLIDEEDIFILEISKETLYDLIGALHSIQKKIKNDNDFNKLSNTF